MHAEPGLEEDPNPFDAEKDAERQALLNRADRTGRKGTKKLTTLTVCVAVLFLSIMYFISSRWQARSTRNVGTTFDDDGSTGDDDSSSSSSSSSDGCTESYTDYTVSKKYCNRQTSPVLRGVDVVAYFDSDSEVINNSTAGSSDISVVYRGYSFYFSNTANAGRFENDPDAYAPQFGGFCAFGLSGEDPMNSITSLSQLSTVPSNPDVAAIYNGKLYLFRGTGARDLFLNDGNTDELIEGSTSLWASWFGDSCDGFYDTICFTGS